MRNIYSGISFFSLICAPGAVEGEKYLTGAALIAIFAIAAYLSMKEDGKIKK